MRNLYLGTVKNHRSFLEIFDNKTESILNDDEIKKFLSEINSQNIKKLRLTDNYVVISFNDYKITITGEFLDIIDNYEEEINILKNKIKKYVEQENLKKYQGKHLKVNRLRSSDTKKMIITGSLVTSLLLTSLGMSLDKSIKKEDTKEDSLPPIADSLLEDDNKEALPLEYDNEKAKDEKLPLVFDNKVEEDKNDEVLITMPNNTNASKPDVIPTEASPESTTKPVSQNDNNSNNNNVNENSTVNNNSNNVNNDSMDSTYVYDLEFRDSTQNKKLATTKEYLGKYIEHYALRWGLPVNLVLAQISQERPNVKDGKIKNPCQLTSKYFIGVTFKVPVYDENGFTGTYDEFKVTEASINTPEGNIMAGLAYLRQCIDNSKGLLTGVFLYNQGEPSLRAACKYYNVDINDYKGDKAAPEACELIKNYSLAVHGKGYGDPNYIANVLQYLEIDEEGRGIITYYLGSQKVDIIIYNTLIKNDNMVRG